MNSFDSALDKLKEILRAKIKVLKCDQLGYFTLKVDMKDSIALINLPEVVRSYTEMEIIKTVLNNLLKLVEAKFKITGIELV